MLIDISAESGSIDEAEAELLDRVFHFGDRHVHEVMVPRTEAVWHRARGDAVEDFYAVLHGAPHSRFPVFDDSPDKVVGIVGIKDVLDGAGDGSHRLDERRSSRCCGRPLFVPETKLIGDLFREMQLRGDQMAIAVDECGGTAGIVTLEQLLEEMVGPGARRAAARRRRRSPCHRRAHDAGRGQPERRGGARRSSASTSRRARTTRLPASSSAGSATSRGRESICPSTPTGLRSRR